MGLRSWLRGRKAPRGENGIAGEVTKPKTGPNNGEGKKKSKAKSEICLARLPSRLLVDVDFLKELGGSDVSQSQRCQLIHLVVDSVKIDDGGCLPHRGKAAEKQRLKSFCTVSIGRQTFVTPDQVIQKDRHECANREGGDAGGTGGTEDKEGADAMPSSTQSSFVVRHDCGATFVVSDQGATKLRVGVYCRGRLDGALKNKFIGFSLLDLEPLIRVASLDDREMTLDDVRSQGRDMDGKGSGKLPGHLYQTKVDVCAPSGDVVVGELTINARAASVVKLEEQLWMKLLTIGDWDESDGLDYDEFQCVLQAFGSDASSSDFFDVFEKARELASMANPEAETATKLDVVSIAKALTRTNETDEPGANLCRFVPYCPVDGAVFPTDPACGASNVLYCWLALSQSIGDAGGEMKAGYLTESEASRAWALKLTEWNGIHPSRKKKVSSSSKAKNLGGLRVGASAHSILLFDRTTKQVVEEIVSPLVIMAMRTLYQSKIGRRFLRNSGFLARMCDMSVSEGAYRDSEESAKDIAPFIESFKGQLDMSSAEKPASEYATFNEFFARKLKDGARPISDAEGVILSAADCRLNVYASVDDATRFWVKGRNFSLAGLLADEALASNFHGGSMAIFRLAPQDYHRFHSPVAGTIVSICDVPGHLLTVNPIAVNCVHADVFTVNKRSVMIIDTPDLGQVAFVAIGATLVGSIVWTASPGDVVQRGTELGLFKFGGSTCIALFMKNVIKFDDDVLANSLRSLETLVKMGEVIGIRRGRLLTRSEELMREEMLTAATTAVEVAGVLPLEQRLSTMRRVGGLDDVGEEEEEGLSTVCSAIL